MERHLVTMSSHYVEPERAANETRTLCCNDLSRCSVSGVALTAASLQGQHALTIVRYLRRYIYTRT